ncbi:Elongation factor Ts, mitochondrial 2 [Grifola frondosa]|uniref:Elongation factor Ts, mitochondrial n=1 Tax=Grifola frondosa TaxID=5627 RepID=A0A1C7MCC2_GRIFR|nr:Elongation factor Ts, mitochondrial 2 [Grifola frondosa]
MFNAARRALLPSRLYSTAPQSKPSLKLVAELRKLTEVSITKAREALIATNNDVPSALKWLEDDRAATGAAKAAKLADRNAGEGLIGVQVLSAGAQPGARGGVRAAMVELNCETDFVARNELFGKLLAEIAYTAAFLAEPEQHSVTLLKPFSCDALSDAPLIGHRTPIPGHVNVGSAVRDLVTKVGENITLRRAVTVVRDPLPFAQRHLGLRVFPFVHGAVHGRANGTKAALALLALKSHTLPTLVASEEFQLELAALERSLGRQIVGFPTTVVRSPLGGQDPGALYEQPSDLFTNKLGSTVEEELRLWARKHGMEIRSRIVCCKRPLD